MNSYKNLRSKLSTLVSATCLSALCLSSTIADDTEVFFGQADPDQATAPNVLFVLDSSISMGSLDGTGISRLDRMKTAMDAILDNTSNINVGLARMNGTYSGGSILYPITPIDRTVCSSFDCGEQHISSQIIAGGDDVEQSLASGNVLIPGVVLDLGQQGNTPNLVGLRYPSLNIPQGAKITSAKLDFMAERSSIKNANLTIQAHLAGDSEQISNANGALEALPRTSSIADWDNVEPWVRHNFYESADFSEVLQEIVDQNDWCGGNAATILIEGSGDRKGVTQDSLAPLTQAFGNLAFSPTELRVSYDASNIPDGGGCAQQAFISRVSQSSDDARTREDIDFSTTTNNDLRLSSQVANGNREQSVGVRFQNVQIPKGAQIVEAELIFEIERLRTGTLTVNINGVDEDHVTTFRNVPDDITDRTKTTAVQPWEIVEAPAENEILTSPDVSSIVTEIVNRDGWAPGNAMAFVLSNTGTNNFREIKSYDGYPASAPKLRVSYISRVGEIDNFITARDKLKDLINTMQLSWGTPTIGTYLEAVNYYRGSPVDYGRFRKIDEGPNAWRNDPRANRVSVPDSYTGGQVNRESQCNDGDLSSAACDSEYLSNNPVYKSPIQTSCQSNHIVYLSDGAAESNTAVTKIQNLIGKNCGGSGNGKCGPELAEWINNNDQSISRPDEQTISTYTIGFNTKNNDLQDMARAGGGQYYEADSSAELVNVFQSILGNVLAVNTSFVAPGATVNQFNRLTHRNDIYFALFKPEERPLWPGNLKRYELGKVDNEPVIVDESGNRAVDPNTGFFDTNSQSFWGGFVDGDSVSLGGAADQLEFSPTAPRKVYTYMGNYPVPAGGVDLTRNENEFHEDNGLITSNELAISNDVQERIDLLRWARGIDVLDSDGDDDHTDWRQSMGDPMHARPVILNYGDGTTPVEGSSDSLVFVGTNTGYLHAFETEHGREHFSFVPKDLLSNFKIYYDNQVVNSHPYGLDGILSIWATDENGNVTVDPGEKAFVYTGMRRGGDKYYAFNVSDKNKPRLAWVIDPSTPGFEQLGQTWSKMSPAKIRYKGDERNVLIFGAGYDENQDLAFGEDANRNTVKLDQTTDSVGRGFYIVDAEDGELLYSALPTDVVQTTGDFTKFDRMDYSMPGNLRLLDADFDGFTDQIYASDTGGQIWRFDLTPHHETGDFMRGGVLAHLNEGGETSQRRFYYEPDVAVISNEGERFISISIGSGWRAHPLDEITQDKFYMIRSSHLFTAPPGYGKTTDGGFTYEPITESDLIDVTYDLNAPTNKYGWAYDLQRSGEKVLGTALTANNQVIFSTYRPAANVGHCSPAIGSGALYALSVLNGAPVNNLSQDGDSNQNTEALTEEDRSIDLVHGGIPPEPALLITEAGPTLLAGPEQPFDPNLDDLTRRTYWIDKGQTLDQLNQASSESATD